MSAFCSPTAPNDDHDILELYTIHFNEDHTLELHNAYVGYNLSSSFSSDFHFLPWLPGYTARLDNHTIHELVRRDPGVSFVEAQAVLSKRAQGPEFSRLDKRDGWTRVREVGPWNLRMISLEDLEDEEDEASDDLDDPEAPPRVNDPGYNCKPDPEGGATDE